MKSKLVAVMVILLLQTFSAVDVCGAEFAHVILLRVPDDGIQPQTVMDGAGIVHLIYYKGAPAGGDVFYARLNPGQSEFSKAIRVNRQDGSAVAIGTIRGPQFAVGKNGRVHVVWNGGSGAARVIVSGQETTPLLYSRLNDAGTAFEPERNLITQTAGLDGGSSVAADGGGNVWVVWHGHEPGVTNGDAGRAVYVTRSTDEGKTFCGETRAISNATGACSCCSLRAFADAAGLVNILYRAATGDIHRDEILLAAKKPSGHFEMTTLDKWNASVCPMSSGSLSPVQHGLLAAWETAGQVYFARVKGMRISDPVCPAGAAKRKHPVAVANRDGEILLLWTEGTGWNKGGALAWQVYDANGKAASEEGRVEGIPTWSFATAFARSDGSFAIVY